MPKSLVSDRDPLFISKLWQELFKLSGKKLRFNSTYHPQSDGQTYDLGKIYTMGGMVLQYLEEYEYQ